MKEKNKAQKSHMYTNGFERKRFNDDCVPAGWVFSPKPPRKKKKHITDGVNYRLVDAETPIPEGWYRGIPEARKQKISQTESGKRKSEHHREAAKAFWNKARNGKHWYTDGQIDGLFYPEQQPEGWVPGQGQLRRRKNSLANMGKKADPSSAVKRVATRKANNSYQVSKETRERLRKANLGKKQSAEVIRKRQETLRRNGTFNSSFPEKSCKNFFKMLYTDTQVEYHDVRYPYACDLYIPRFDLFIELNGHWTHGSHPFNPDNPEDQVRLKDIRSKQGYYISKKTNQLRPNSYFIAEKVWVERDRSKLETAKKNKLNYIAIYNITSQNAELVTTLDLKQFHGICIIDMNKLMDLREGDIII